MFKIEKLTFEHILIYFLYYLFFIFIDLSKKAQKIPIALTVLC